MEGEQSLPPMQSVQLQAKDYEVPVKHEVDFHRVVVGERAQAIVAARDHSKTDSLQPSLMPEILFLKFPATMLQTSPTASSS